MIDWTATHAWAQAEYVAASDKPADVRARVATCGGAVEAEFTLEEKYGAVGPGAREARFTVVLKGRRFAIHPGMNGVRYRETDLGKV